MIIFSAWWLLLLIPVIGYLIGVFCSSSSGAGVRRTNFTILFRNRTNSNNRCLYCLLLHRQMDKLKPWRLV